MNEQMDTAPVPTAAPTGERPRDMLLSIQALQNRPDASKREFEGPASKFKPAQEITEYTFNLPPQSTIYPQDNILRLQVIRNKAEESQGKPMTTYFLYKMERTDERNAEGKVVDTWKVTSRFLMDVQPRFLRPDKITVTEATALRESRTKSFEKLTGSHAKKEVEAKFNIEIKDKPDEIETEKREKFETPAEQRAFLDALLTI